MKPMRARVTVWSVSEDEFVLLEEETHRRFAEWKSIPNLLEKIWIGSFDRKYWGAIMCSTNHKPIDCTKQINIGEHVTGRSPILDQEFIVIEHLVGGESL
ncbi:hypothetical protein CMUST_14525 [Corynebacterium mustelae]|uniref:Uncharacterized protein n=1 Tax=Corynebacterium mustelae TaxID=571915 RepID=A0A0G3H5U4_9CORY|nr:hypothetical protein CMUST_14525 [Corynebacterium mustelae]